MSGQGGSPAAASQQEQEEEKKRKKIQHNTQSYYTRSSSAPSIRNFVLIFKVQPHTNNTVSSFRERSDAIIEFDGHNLNIQTAIPIHLFVIRTLMIYTLIRKNSLTCLF